MHVIFCPIRRLAETAQQEGLHRCAAIISSSQEPDASRLPQIPYVFRQYEDLDREVPGRSFSEADAKAFADFVRNLSGWVDTFICCCDAAQSRSPAVAAAVCRYFGQPDHPIWSDPSVCPNMLVFDLLTIALGIPVSDMEKDALLYENRQAFRKAIRANRA